MRDESIQMLRDASEPMGELGKAAFDLLDRAEKAEAERDVLRRTNTTLTAITMAARESEVAALAREAALRVALSAVALLAALPYESSGQRIVGLMTIAKKATDTLLLSEMPMDSADLPDGLVWHGPTGSKDKP